jgi:hypothetical protein
VLFTLSRSVTACIPGKEIRDGRRVDAGQKRLSKGHGRREQPREQEASAMTPAERIQHVDSRSARGHADRVPRRSPVRSGRKKITKRLEAKIGTPVITDGEDLPPLDPGRDIDGVAGLA